MYPITRRKMLSAAVGGAGAAAFWQVRRRPASPQPDPFASRKPGLITQTGRGLGADIELTVFHGDEAVARAALRAAFDELKSVERVLSLYCSDSQLCRLNREGSLAAADPHLLAVLGYAQRLAERSGGGFDVSVQPLWELYRRSADGGRLPAPQELQDTLGRVGWRRIQVEGARVRLAPGTSLTFNGIAQGYAADRVRSVFAAHGIVDALIDVGELGASGSKPGGMPWSIGIQHPRVGDAYVCVARLRDRFLATSGDYETSFSPDHRHHHIVDPTTGRSPLEFSSVSVAAGTGMEADALSTASFVLGYERGRRLIESIPGADAFFVFKDGSVASTPGFPQAV